MAQRLLVRFWGVRGSYPTPGFHTLRHGGNTSCVEVQAGTHKLVFDAGSGIIRLGDELLRNVNGTTHLSLFLTHAHGDHLVGFPFFAPLFDARTNIHLFGPQLAAQTIEQIVTPMMSPPYFPVDIHNLPSQRTFHTVTDDLYVTWQPDQGEPLLNGARNGEEVCVQAKFTRSHPLNGAVVYSVEYAGRRIVYATDVEWPHGCEPEVLAFMKGADLLIHDAQYTVDDYRRGKYGFGHSTVEMAVEAAQLAHVHELILFHHEPTYSDDQLDTME